MELSIQMPSPVRQVSHETPTVPRSLEASPANTMSWRWGDEYERALARDTADEAMYMLTHDFLCATDWAAVRRTFRTMPRLARDFVRDALRYRSSDGTGIVHWAVEAGNLPMLHLLAEVAAASSLDVSSAANLPNEAGRVPYDVLIARAALRPMEEQAPELWSAFLALRPDPARATLDAPLLAWLKAIRAATPSQRERWMDGPASTQLRRLLESGCKPYERNQDGDCAWDVALCPHGATSFLNKPLLQCMWSSNPVKNKAVLKDNVPLQTLLSSMEIVQEPATRVEGDSRHVSDAEDVTEILDGQEAAASSDACRDMETDIDIDEEKGHTQTNDADKASEQRSCHIM